MPSEEMWATFMPNGDIVHKSIRPTREWAQRATVGVYVSEEAWGELGVDYRCQRVTVTWEGTDHG